MMLSSLKYCTTYLLTKSQRSKCTYNRADWDALHEEMAEISRYYFERNENNNRSVEDNWNYIHVNLLKVIDTYIPVKFTSNSNNSPWMTPQLKRLIRKKQHFYNKAKRTNQSTDWAEYKVSKANIFDIKILQQRISCLYRLKSGSKHK